MGSVPCGRLVCRIPESCRAEAGEWSGLPEAKALYAYNVSDWSVTRRLALSKDLSQPTIMPFPNSRDVAWESLDVRRVLMIAFGQTECSINGTGILKTDHSILMHGNDRLQAGRRWLQIGSPFVPGKGFSLCLE